jgi:hypothetical protein
VLSGTWLPSIHQTDISGRPSMYRKIVRCGCEWLLSRSESTELRPSSVSLTSEGGAEGATRVLPVMQSTPVGCAGLAGAAGGKIMISWVLSHQAKERQGGGQRPFID